MGAAEILRLGLSNHPLVGDGERFLRWLCLGIGCLLIASLNLVMGVSAGRGAHAHHLFLLG